MQINYLRINGFGKINNKEINLKNNINLINGKNESGKSTILKFILSMLYGISKNKNGKGISDYDRYLPWNSEEFSGKIKYTLDNNEQYEIFREFKKKNPKIYNSNLEEISKNFSIDKTKGNEFFYEQTKLNEQILYSTTVIEQNEMVLNDSKQNVLTQKITNLLSSGEENISYKKTIEKLNKKLIEEVGTERTVGRPLNEVTERIRKITQEKNLLKQYESQKQEFGIEIKKLKNELDEETKRIETLKKIEQQYKEVQFEQEKIKINYNLQQEYDNKIDELNQKLQNIKLKEKSDKKYILIFIILLILNIAVCLFTNKVIAICGTALCIVAYTICIKSTLKNQKHKKQQIQTVNKIKNEIELIQENKNKNDKEIQQKENNLQEFINTNNIDINSKAELENIEKEHNIKSIKYYAMLEKEKDINKNLEKKAKLEEELEAIEEEKEELLNLEKIINLVRTTIEKSYEEVKQNITPKFTVELTNIIKKITNEKYSKVIFNDENGLNIELKNGKYIPAKRLSIGTIDQLYFALRISAMSEISEEKTPIILDEPFVYFDDERLENILKYLSENYKDNQILLLSCTDREKNILSKLNLNYNLVEI